MRDPRSHLAGVAASTALVAAATLALLIASAVVAFHGSPVGGTAPGSPVALPAVPAQVAAARRAVVLPFTGTPRRAHREPSLPAPWARIAERASGRP